MPKFCVVAGLIFTFFLSSLLFVPFTDADSPILNSSTSQSGENNSAMIPKELWNFTATNTTANTIRISWARPMVAKGVVYITASETYTIPNENYHDHFGFGPPQHTLGTVYALNIYSGAKLWNLTARASIRSSTIIDGVAYICAGSNLYALDAVSGAQIWMYSIGGDILWSSAVINGVLYIGVHGSDYNCYVCALKVTNGDELWKYNAGWGVSVSYPAIDDTAVYFGTFSASNHYYAVNSTNGDELWSFPVDSHVQASSTIANDIVYFASNNYLYALNAENGEKLWSYPATFTQESSPIVVDGIVHINGGDSEVYALDASNGNKLWNFTTSNMFLPSLTVNDGVVYASSGGNLYALNAADGAQIWNYNTGGTTVSPTITKGAIYFKSGNNFYALNAANGNKFWSYSAGTTSVWSPAVLDGVLYFSLDGNLHAYSISSELSPSPSPTGSKQPANAELPNQFLIVTLVVVVAVFLSATVLVKKRNNSKSPK